jgi:cytoskeletal protein RodZ
MMFRTNGAADDVGAPHPHRGWVPGHRTAASGADPSSAGAAPLVAFTLTKPMPGIGPTLRDARIRARVDMAEVEARTKIRAKYLRAIENEEWDLLPGPVYIKSFLRTYGDYLGLDSRMLVEEFKRRYEEPLEHDMRPIAPVRRERELEHGQRPRLTFPPWLAVVGVLVAVVVILYIVGTNSSNKHQNSQQTSARAGVHQHKHHHHSSPHKAKTSPVAPPKPRKVTLQLTPTAAVYVCLENGARKVLIPGLIYNVGQTIPTETAKEFFLTLGNANVEMKINGKTVAVPQSTTAIGLRIVPQGAVPLPAGAGPTCT